MYYDRGHLILFQRLEIKFVELHLSQKLSYFRPWRNKLVPPCSDIPPCFREGAVSNNVLYY